MTKNEILAIIIVIVATLGTVLAALGFENYRRGRVYTVELIARALENGSWYPQKIKVPYGEEVRILIRNIDTVTHGFAIPELGVSIGELNAGNTKLINFKPERKGTFPFMCTVWCSKRHIEMRGELTVE